MAELLREYKTKFLGKKLTRKQIGNLCKEYKAKIYAFTDNLNTRSKYLAQMNTHIRTTLGQSIYEKVSYNILKPETEQKQKQIAQQQTSVLHRLKNKIGIDATKYMNAIDTLKASNNFYEIGACICLATGRRIIETFKSAKFDKVDINKVMFSGQAKATTVRKPYEIYVLGMTSDELIKLTNKLRKMCSYKTTSNEKVVASVAKYVNKSLHELLGDKVSSETVRAFYSHLCYKKYGNPQISEAIFGAEILGHQFNEMTDINTYANHYAGTYAINEEDISTTTLRQTNINIETLMQQNKQVIDLLTELLKNKKITV